MAAPQTIPNIPQTDYTDPNPANPIGTLWAQSPTIPQPDTHVGGSAVPKSKTILATLTGPNGTPVGFVIDGITYSIPDATSAADFAAKWSAKNTHSKIAAATSPEATKVRLVLHGLADPAIAAYAPGAPNFTPIVVEQAGSNPQYIKAGRAVIRYPGGPLGAVTRPAANTTGDQILGVALRSNLHTDQEAELLGWEPGAGLWPGSHCSVITGGYPKVELSSSPGAGVAGGEVWCVVGDVPESGTFRANDGGTAGIWTLTFSAANGTDSVGAYFNGYLVALGGPCPGTAVDATNAANFAAKLAADPVLGSRFTSQVAGAVVTVTATDKTAWSIVKYKPATSDVTVANPTPRTAATAVLVPRSRWGLGHAPNASAGYLELHI